MNGVRIGMGLGILGFFGNVIACSSDGSTNATSDASASDGRAGDAGRDAARPAETSVDDTGTDARPQTEGSIDDAGTDARAPTESGVDDAGTDAIASEGGDERASPPDASDASSTSDAPVDAAVDAPSADANASCPTAGGLYSVGMQVGAVVNSGAPIAGATIYVDACGGQPAGTTDANAKATVVIPGGLPIYYRAEKTGYFSSLSAEFMLPVNDGGIFSAGSLPVPTAMWTRSLGGDAGVLHWFPDYDPSKAHLVVSITPPNGATCSTRDGYVVSVTGHPEAKVLYINSSAQADPSLTATTAAPSGGGGYAVVENLTPGSPVTVVGTKPGCSLTFTSPPPFNFLTGKAPAVAGAITGLNAGTTP